MSPLVREERTRPDRQGARLGPLARERLMDLQVLGRSPQTIHWYQQKLDTYLRDGVQSLEELTAFAHDHQILATPAHQVGLQDEHVAAPPGLHMIRKRSARSYPLSAFPAMVSDLDLI